MVGKNREKILVFIKFDEGFVSRFFRPDSGKLGYPVKLEKALSGPTLG